MPFRADDVFDELTVGTSPVGEIHIFDDTIGSPPGPVIEFTDAGGTRWVIDAFQVVGNPNHHVLNISRAAGGFIAAPQVVLRYDSDTGLTNVFLIADHLGTQSAVDTLMQGPVIDIAPSTSLQLQAPTITIGPGSVDLPGDQFDAEAWQDVATGVGFKNGWANFGGAENNAQFRRRGRSVEIIGTVKNGAVGAGLPVFTLPAGYRPKGQTERATIYSGSGGLVAQVAINALSGDVVIVYGSATATSIDVAFPTD